MIASATDTQLHPNQFLAYVFIFDLVMCHSSSIPEVVFFTVLASKYLSNLSFNMIKCCYCIYIFSKALDCLYVDHAWLIIQQGNTICLEMREILYRSTLKEKSLLQYMENSVNIQSVMLLENGEMCTGSCSQ